MVLQNLNFGLSNFKHGFAELEPLVRPWYILGSSLARPWFVLGSSLACPMFVFGSALVCPWCRPWFCPRFRPWLVLGLSLACPFFRNSKNSNKQQTEPSEPFGFKAGGPQSTSP